MDIESSFFARRRNAAKLHELDTEFTKEKMPAHLGGDENEPDNELTADEHAGVLVVHVRYNEDMPRELVLQDRRKPWPPPLLPLSCWSEATSRPQTTRRRFCCVGGRERNGSVASTRACRRGQATAVTREGAKPGASRAVCPRRGRGARRRSGKLQGPDHLNAPQGRSSGERSSTPV